MQSGALDENLLPDVTVFELDLEEDSDEEILFAKAMPVRSTCPTVMSLSQVSSCCIH